MKKLICLILAITLSNCEISPRKSVASDFDRIACGSWQCAIKSDVTISGMKYGVFSTENDDSLFVINLTKDSLEVELLKKQFLK